MSLAVSPLARVTLTSAAIQAALCLMARDHQLALSRGLCHQIPPHSDAGSGPQLAGWLAKAAQTPFEFFSFLSGPGADQLQVICDSMLTIPPPQLTRSCCAVR